MSLRFMTVGQMNVQVRVRMIDYVKSFYLYTFKNHQSHFELLIVIV